MTSDYMSDSTAPTPKPSMNGSSNNKSGMPEGERVKLESDYLRGTLKESLKDAVTGALHENDTHLSKFHGFYQQDNRDLREERRHQKLEPRYQFMLRLRLPGGALSPAQWLGLDDICGTLADGSLRLTTRQTFQFHEIFKHQLRPFIQAMDKLGLDSKGACGDVNRNVVTNINPYLSHVHQQLHQLSVQISERLCWRSGAYDEIWLDRKPVERPEEEEPFYTHRYLPRKFKVAIALPPQNDCDVLANDIGLIAIEQAGTVVGFNVAVGGGLGMTYGNAKTYPRLATPIGFVPAEDIVEACADIVAIQRDFGDRTDRAHARFKYTLDDYGLEWFKDQFQSYHGKPMQPLRDYVLEDSGDQFGWLEDDQGLNHLTLFIPSGRIIDREEAPLRTGVREIAQYLFDQNNNDRDLKGELRITCNQNLVIANVRPENREAIEKIVVQYQLDDGSHSSAVYRNAISCVAFPTCGLAMAEAERYLPEFTHKVEALMLETGIDKETIQLRVSGCPNGCARPYLGEIGLTGKALGKYNLFLGADRSGQRLNRLCRENINEQEILSSLQPLFQDFSEQRHPGEAFGDFLYRTGILAENGEDEKNSENKENSSSENFHHPLIAKSG